ncbi:hypothetical protein ASPZODRAFT_133320 [Penicilliopsis zonata CBS 506.65]|uniref:Uncharacterized protein n=1 Tax=Penicilliopsis zonata CBS 506.65 TaxID=1073090 RepID=A0A1L9SGC8_9EURO|nr:hypothetical protein ASPZODRAFT_133320 [Penicilliopsis zonata CBS 506.65]OJJ46290.1 hypothetical protein ASPZODRAFT_133320 [Penicilliopsis zonata CBS 506.65]
MDTDIHEGEGLEPPRDGLNNQGVYIYAPPKQSKGNGERAPKRRKIHSNTAHNTVEGVPFVPLLNGEEDAESVRCRYTTYKQFWSQQDRKIQAILKEVDSKVLESVSSFVQTTSPETYNDCIPTALVTVGSNVSALSRLLSRLNSRLTTSGEGGVVAIESGDAHNLKTALKNIIRGAITNTEGSDGFQRFLTDRAGPRLLGYDLELLSDYVNRKGIKKLVLVLRDSEAFDAGLMIDLLSLLSSWLDRIPFVLLLGISTSVEIFESRLPRSSVALLRGKHFEIHEMGDCVDRIYEAIQADQDAKLWVGHNVTAAVFERWTDHFQSPETFINTLKYSYMSHFFANPLTALLADSVPANPPSTVLCEAIRNVPSFRSYCEALLENNSHEVRKLLEEDAYLLQEMQQHIKMGQTKMRHISQAVVVIQIFSKKLQISRKSSVSDVSIRALSGDLQNSPLVEDLLEAIKKADSNQLDELLSSLLAIISGQRPEFPRIEKDLKALLVTHKGAEPLRSEYHMRNTVIQTTVVKKQIKLTKSKAKLPQEVIQYTQIVDRLHAAFESYFTETLIQPQDLVMHEVFLFDFKYPLKEVFAPRSRFVTERALSTPFDYLMSTTSEAPGRQRSAKQPATAILYQLYLESGALVNVYDLWSAFFAVFEADQGDEYDERMTMTLFYKALSELKVLGLVKTSRKKVDHISKSAWLGL